MCQMRRFTRQTHRAFAALMKNASLGRKASVTFFETYFLLLKACNCFMALETTLGITNPSVSAPTQRRPWKFLKFSLFSYTSAPDSHNVHSTSVTAHLPPTCAQKSVPSCLCTILYRQMQLHCFCRKRSWPGMKQFRLLARPPHPE